MEPNTQVPGVNEVLRTQFVAVNLGFIRHRVSGDVERGGMLPAIPPADLPATGVAVLFDVLDHELDAVVPSI